MTLRSQAPLAKTLELYAVTDRAWLKGRTLVDCVAQAIDGGVTFVQLREKTAPERERAELARQLRALCAKEGVPFVIDDDIALAKEIGADGVHVGQQDASCAQARAALGLNAIIGVSTQTVDQSLAAEAAGADYLGVGALMPTATKPDAVEVTTNVLRSICEAVSIPVVGIGGMSMKTIPQFAGLGLSGVAVVSAIFAAEDCRTAASELKQAIEEVIA